MPAETPPNVPCPSCDGEGRFWHQPLLPPPMVGLTMGSYVPCRWCRGTGEVSILLASINPDDFNAGAEHPVQSSIGDREVRLTQEVLRLVSLWHHDIITTEELGNAIREMLDS